MRMKNKKLWIATAAAAILLIAVVFEINGVFGSKNTVEIEVVQGEGSSSIADTLKRNGVIGNKTIFKVYARLGGNHIFQKGKHDLSASMGYSGIIKSLEGAPKVKEHKVLIKEGLEVLEIADILQKEGLVNRDTFISLAESGSFDYGFLKNTTGKIKLEGYLFPDTYHFSENEDEKDIINIMLKNFEEKVVPLYNESGADMSLDDVVNLASIVEREAASDEEKPLIASVFLNRMKIGQRLESDSTLQYMSSEKKEFLSISETKDDDPYNTYSHEGLPPGAISSPGLDSIKAVLYPADSNYLYFILSEDKSHSVFSETFEEHLQRQKEIQGN